VLQWVSAAGFGGPPGARPILQTVDLGYREALSPTAYSLPAQSQLVGNLLVVPAVGSPQNDPRAFY